MVAAQHGYFATIIKCLFQFILGFIFRDVFWGFQKADVRSIYVMGGKGLILR